MIFRVSLRVLRVPDKRGYCMYAFQKLLPGPLNPNSLPSALTFDMDGSSIRLPFSASSGKN